MENALTSDREETYPDMGLGMRQTLTLAETLKIVGFHDIRASAPGYRVPKIIKGRHKDFRPDIAARFNNGRPLIVDSLDPTQTDDLTQSRWQLFSSAAVQSRGQFHVVIPEMVKKEAGAIYVKRKAKEFGVDPIHKIWEV